MMRRIRVFEAGACARAAALVTQLAEEALLEPPLWRLFQSVATTVRHLWGPELSPVDAAWCWHTEAGSTGWPLHRDDPRHPDHLTAWLALVDVGPRNGAIRWSPLACARAEEAVSSLEVMPADAGEVLVWDHATWHCGGRVLEGQPARVCAAIEFGRDGAEALDLDAMVGTDPWARVDALKRYRKRYAHLVRAARGLRVGT